MDSISEALHSITKFRLPKSYLDLMEVEDGLEGNTAYGHIMLWARELVIECYRDYEMAEYLDSKYYVVGSNGGAEMLVFDLTSPADAVYMLPFIGMSDEEPIKLVDKFDDLITALRNSSPD